MVMFKTTKSKFHSKNGMEEGLHESRCKNWTVAFHRQLLSEIRHKFTTYTVEPITVEQ